MNQLSPIVVVVQYLDEDEIFPADFVQANETCFEAVITVIHDNGDGCEQRVIGSYATCDEALHAVWQYNDLDNWLPEGQRPN